MVSDHMVSLRRSSNGKSNSVASVIVVSSFETRSTQSNGSPIGSESRISAGALADLRRHLRQPRRRDAGADGLALDVVARADPC